MPKKISQAFPGATVNQKKLIETACLKNWEVLEKIKILNSQSIKNSRAAGGIVTTLLLLMLNLDEKFLDNHKTTFFSYLMFYALTLVGSIFTEIEIGVRYFSEPSYISTFLNPRNYKKQGIDRFIEDLKCEEKLLQKSCKAIYLETQISRLVVPALLLLVRLIPSSNIKTQFCAASIICPIFARFLEETLHVLRCTPSSKIAFEVKKFYYPNRMGEEKNQNARTFTRTFNCHNEQRTFRMRNFA